VSHRISASSAVNARRTFAAAGAKGAGGSAATTDKKKQSTPEQKQQAKATTTSDPEKIEVDTNAESSYTDEVCLPSFPTYTRFANLINISSL